MSDSECSSICSSESFVSRDICFERSVLLKLPKFSKGYEHVDFLAVFSDVIDVEEITDLGRLKYPNEWSLTVKSQSTREKLLQLGLTRVKDQKCVIYPIGVRELRGKIHWLPGEIEDTPIIDILTRFGKVLSFEKEKVFAKQSEAQKPGNLRNVVRYFSLQLKEETNKDDIPHFININKCEGLLIIKGRDPICIGCRKHGHKKAICPKANTKFLKTNKNVPLKARNSMSQSSAKSSEGERITESNPSATDNSVRPKKHGQSKKGGKIETAQIDVSISSSKNTGTATLQLDTKLSAVAGGMKNLQSLSMKIEELNMKLSETLDTVQARLPVLQPVILPGVSSQTQDKKKGKRKQKTSGSYDLVTKEASSQASLRNAFNVQASASIDSRIAVNGSTPVTAENSLTGIANTASSANQGEEKDSDANPNKKKSKKKKKKNKKPTEAVL